MICFRISRGNDGQIVSVEMSAKERRNLKSEANTITDWYRSIELTLFFKSFLSRNKLLLRLVYNLKRNFGVFSDQWIKETKEHNILKRVVQSLDI